MNRGEGFEVPELPSPDSRELLTTSINLCHLWHDFVNTLLVIGMKRGGGKKPKTNGRISLYQHNWGNVTLYYTVTFYSERNKWEFVKVGLGFVSFFMVVLREYFKPQKCVSYKSDADRTKPLTYIKHANRSRHQSFYCLFSCNTFALCATHLRSWRSRNRLVFWVALQEYLKLFRVRWTKKVLWVPSRSKLQLVRPKLFQRYLEVLKAC